MVQAILIALFGLYLIIPGLLYRIGFKYPERIHRNFRAANLLMAISFFVAEFSHMLQAPGLVERKFMRMLANMQIIQYTIIAYGVVAALGVFGQKTSFLTASQLILGGDDWRILDLAPPILSVVYLILDETNYGDPHGWQETVTLYHACAHYGPDILQANVMAVKEGGLKFTCPEVETKVTRTIFYAYAALMGIQLVCGIMFAICWYGTKWTSPAGEDPRFRLHVKRHKFWYRCLPKLGLVLCILLTTAMVISVWIYRFCVDNAVAADAKQDNQWGIGQVLAPAAWVPSILDIATWMYGCFRGRSECILFWYGCGGMSVTPADLRADLGHPEDDNIRTGTQYLGVSPSHSSTTSPPPREGTGGEPKGPLV